MNFSDTGGQPDDKGRPPPYILRMNTLTALWQGNLRLSDAFWTWAVLGALAINVTTSVLFLALIARDLPWIALLVGYGVSVPYNVMALVGVWRAAARHDGPPPQAELARWASLILLGVLSVT
jgi:hypothetical protein